MKKNILKYILAISICFCLSVPALATYENPSGSAYSYVLYSGSTSTTNYWNAVTLSLSNIGQRVKDIYDKVYSSNSYLNSINSNVSQIKSSMGSNSGPSGSSYKYFNGTNSTSNTSNYWSAATNSLLYIGIETEQIAQDLTASYSVLSQIRDVIANTTDQTLRHNQESNIQEATSDFFSGSESSTSIGTGTIRSIKGSFGDAQSFFGMGEGIDIFGALTDDSSTGPWQWFTQAVKDDISTVQNSRDEIYIDFLTPKNEDLLSRLGGEEDDAR